MNFKKCIIFIVLIVFLFTIASVSAADMNETATTSTDEYEIELSQNDEKEITGQNENSKFESGNTGTFSELQNSINNNYGETLKLNKSYECEDDFSSEGIVINGHITIDGQGYTIDAKGKARIFYVNSENVIIKNIIFKNGKATDDGGAIRMSSGTVSNCNFTNNRASGDGGAIRMSSGTVSNCNFTGNTANDDGGAINMGSGTVSNCNFTDNTAYEGGAVYFWNNGEVTNCNFADNTAYRSGAVYFDSTGTVTNCNFTNNTAMYDGGSVCFWDFGNVTNCNFTGNSARNGGAVYFSRTGSVSNCNFTGNTADYGGAIRMSSGTVTNCNFTNNTAKMGNAIYIDNNCTISDCDFTNNPITKGAIHSVTGDITLSNNIINVDDVVSDKNFTEIQKLIDQANDGDEITINGLYAGFGIPIRITKSLTLNGQNNTTLDAKKLSKTLYITANNVIIKNIQFTSGYAEYGGAIYFSSTGTVTNCNFTGNTASEDGGAVYFKNSGNVTNCNFTNNTANESGGAIRFSGSGTVTNCNFTNNTANEDGGAIRFSGSGTVTNCNFTNNKATGTYYLDGGGAVYFRDFGNVTNCNFTGNTATRYGGAVYFSITGTVSNCNFTGNTANDDGGAVYFWDPGTVTNCNFADNSASRGGAIFSMEEYTTADTCIFKRNSGDNVNTFIYPPTLNVDNFTTVYGSGEKLTFDLKTNSSIPVTNGNISISVYFKDNGEWVRNYTCLSGEGWIPDLPVGFYIAFFDTEYAEFQKINRTVKITMPKVRYSINVTSLTTNNKTVNITAKTDIPKNITWESKLLFILPNGTEISANYSAGGIWWAVYEFSNPGVYNVSASYSSCEVNVTEGTITILADVPIIVSDVIITFGDDAVVVVSVPDAINGQNITIAVNSSSKNATVKNGKANATFTNLAFGDYVIVVVYLGDELNSANSTTAKLTVNKATPKIEVQSYDVIYPDDVVISVKSDIAGLYIVNVGNESKNVTLEVGVEQNVTFTGLGVNEEGYVVNVTNADLENCTQSVNDTGIVKVMHAPSYINTDGLITVYNSGGVLFVSLTGIDGEPLAGRGIKVNITGKTYTIITNASGIAGLPINLKPGLHLAYVWFNGDSTYAPSENVSTTVEVSDDSRITGNKDLVKKQGGSEPFKVRALDKYGKPVGAYAKVKMTVAGKTYTVNTDAKGYASLPINLKAGKYKITTVYGGTTVTNTITVKK